MKIEEDYSYEILRNLSIYLNLKGVRKEIKIKKYKKVMNSFNKQKKFMFQIRDDFKRMNCDTLNNFVLNKNIKKEEFRYDELRLFWD